mmetsp:Transcript_47408/g.112837  ORF Transcript_47408/g.112837 Transcript_47408/m.112837 type:complete len:263 (-) Transcript_47408:160-948(-)
MGNPGRGGRNVPSHRALADDPGRRLLSLRAQARDRRGGPLAGPVERGDGGGADADRIRALHLRHRVFPGRHAPRERRQELLGGHLERAHRNAHPHAPLLPLLFPLVHLLLARLHAPGLLGRRPARQDLGGGQWPTGHGARRAPGRRPRMLLVAEQQLPRLGQPRPFGASVGHFNWRPDAHAPWAQRGRARLHLQNRRHRPAVPLGRAPAFRARGSVLEDRAHRVWQYRRHVQGVGRDDGRAPPHARDGCDGVRPPVRERLHA